MPDYQEMYLTLMRETEKAIRILIEAQQRCEELYLRDEGLGLHVLPFSESPASAEKEQAAE